MNNKPKTKTYFAFGSNMSLERIRRRCPSAVKLGVGWLDDFELVFNMPGVSGEGKGGGIANIIAKSGSRVYGVLYSIESVELEHLSNLEKSMNYSVYDKQILSNNQDSKKASIFIGPELNTAHIPPTKTYGEFLLEGIKENDVPDEYFHKIRKLIQTNK